MLTLGITPIERQLRLVSLTFGPWPLVTDKQQRLRDTASLAREVVLAVRSRTWSHGQRSPPCACSGSGSVTGTRRPSPRRASDRPSGSQARNWRETARSDHQRATDRDERKEGGLSGRLLQPSGAWSHPACACRGGRSSRVACARPRVLRVPALGSAHEPWRQTATHKRRLRRGRATRVLSAARASLTRRHPARPRDRDLAAWPRRSRGGEGCDQGWKHGQASVGRHHPQVQARVAGPAGHGL